MLIKLYKLNTYIVGTYSPGNELVVYDMSIHVLPTAPSPTTTHFMSLSVLAILEVRGGEGRREVGLREGERKERERKEREKIEREGGKKKVEGWKEE